MNSTQALSAQETLWRLIQDIRFAMLVTQSPTGDLRSHPITTQNRTQHEDSVLWFFLSSHSEVVRDIQHNPRVNLAYASPEDDHYVSVTGSARVVDSIDKKRELWSTMSQAWFPGGVSDPDLTLLGVDISTAEYWDVKSSKMVQLFKMARAVMKGEQVSRMGEHGHVQIG